MEKHFEKEKKEQASARKEVDQKEKPKKTRNPSTSNDKPTKESFAAKAKASQSVRF